MKRKIKSKRIDELTVDFDDIVADDLRKDEFAAMFLDDVVNASDSRVFLLALGRVAKARGIGVAQLAKKLKLTRRGFYYALSKTGRSQLSTLSQLLHALGLRISVQAREAS